MNFLAFDTSTDFLSMAIHREGYTCAIFHEFVGQKHAEAILPTLKQLLAQQSLSLAQLDGIAFGCGPGSFTGLRIACGIAQGLALNHNIPLYPISTLAQVAWQSKASQICAVLDARMGQVYYGNYQRQPLTLVGDLNVCDPENLHALNRETRFVGQGLQAYTDQFSDTVQNQINSAEIALRPHAQAMIEMLQEGIVASVEAHAVDLIYIREKVALTQAEQNAKNGLTA